MKIINKNLKQGKIKVKPENLDDLWCLSTLVGKGDLVSGRTFRKIVIGDKGTDRAKSVKKPMFLTIEVEKVSFEDNLSILGKVKIGPEDVAIGSHHSFNVEENDEIEIEKEWLSYQLKKLNESVERETAKVLACIFNREEAVFAKLEKNKFMPFSRLQGVVEKKAEGSDKGSNFFKEINTALEEMNIRFEPKSIIVASSHMWKNNIEKEIDLLKTKIVYAIVNDTSESGFAELLRRPEVENALKNQQASKDARLVDEILALISKDGKVVYGIADCIRAGSSAAIEKLVCSENLIKDKRENDTFDELDTLFKDVEKNKGEVHLISGKGDYVRRLDGLGGITAKLRFEIE